MKAMVVLSGGMDSAFCLAWALETFEAVEAVTFHYGQRHEKEVTAADAMCRLADVAHHVLSVHCFDMTQSALIDKERPTSGHRADGLPDTFVPGRNIVFLAQAAALADARGCLALVTGVCQTDFSGYPDCRRSVMNAMTKVLELGIEKSITIHTPLMYLTKAETVTVAGRLRLGMDLIGLSWTCYKGEEKPCGVCPSCELRIRGFKEAGVDDPALQ